MKACVQLVLLVAALALAGTASAANLPSQFYQYKFEAYMRAFNKQYDEQELGARFAAFQANYDYVEAQNAKFARGESTFEVEMNQFADLTQEEFASMYLSKFNSTRPKNVVFLPEANDDSVDWRQKNAVTPVKNQGQCGSCWSFSTTGSVEGAWAIAHGNLVSCSEQQLVDCSGSFGNQGCNGGLMDDAFKYIIKNGGIDTEGDYPYTARDGSCNKQKEAKHVVSITNFQDVPQNNEAQLAAAVAKGPVSVAIEADQQAFQLYKSGVFNGDCGTQLDHGVLTVGYGALNGQNYWIVKNSWGASWGMQGYILLSRGQKGAAGQCGIAMQPSYPIAGSGPSPSPGPHPSPSPGPHPSPSPGPHPSPSPGPHPSPSPGPHPSPSPGPHPSPSPGPHPSPSPGPHPSPSPSPPTPSPPSPSPPSPSPPSPSPPSPSPSPSPSPPSPPSPSPSPSPSPPPPSPSPSPSPPPPSPSPSPSPPPPSPNPPPPPPAPAPSPPAPAPGPSPSLADGSHYEAPPCQSGEVAVQIQGIAGTFCSPKCSSRQPCPTDVPSGTTAKPECVLEMPGHASPTNCALICSPGPNAGCPSGATCQAIQGTGVCTYPKA